MNINKCRSCANINLKKAFNIGTQKLTGIFPRSVTEKVPSAPLELVFCEKCKLLQLKNSFDSSYMYGDNYGYMSSLNISMLQHLKNKSEKLQKIIKLNIHDIVIDIGSNDGSFLSYFPNKLKLIGIDPTIKKLSNFYKKNIIQIDDFFSAQKIFLITKKKAKLITSISMFYDLDNPIKFAQDINEVLDDNGIWHLEQSYMPMMLKNNSYDTICHEHLEYYSLTSIKFILDKAGFKIIDLEFNGINGGSFALTAAKKESKFKEASFLINWLLKKEDLFKYNDLKTFKIFFNNIVKHKKIFKDLLLNLRDMKKKVIGYGASTKGNVIIQFCEITKKLIPYIADVNDFKHNRYTPGSKIKIISEKKAKLMKPDYFLIFPWHFKNFFIEKEKFYLKQGGKLIFPLPDIEII
jgi:hypothetical protein